VVDVTTARYVILTVLARGTHATRKAQMKSGRPIVHPPGSLVYIILPVAFSVFLTLRWRLMQSWLTPLLLGTSEQLPKSLHHISTSGGRGTSSTVGASSGKRCQAQVSSGSAQRWWPSFGPTWWMLSEANDSGWGSRRVANL
jgi:hypothetical protein